MSLLNGQIPPFLSTINCNTYKKKMQTSTSQIKNDVLFKQRIIHEHTRTILI